MRHFDIWQSLTPTFREQAAKKEIMKILIKITCSPKAREPSQKKQCNSCQSIVKTNDKYF